ncbi:zinc finger protein SNAI3 [Chrysemys picta bellii]|uniref:Zinc finger protein SNAI2 n=1 Tax=Chrysemys picta bellii TaxID=8478 RepID=A0A8C3IGA1_CHRPI|nr:zinc finger protein SNAI3 [Chrysemys picta bellii]
MPRSFLVKKPCSTRVPNYGQLETRRRQEINGACHSCGGLVFPILIPNDSAPSTPWDGSSILARFSLPLPLDGDTKRTPSASPHNLEISLVDTLTGRAPGTPLKDNQNNLNLPPVLSLPPGRPSDPGSPAEGDRGAQDKLPGARGGAAEPLERFECFDCHKSYHTFSGLAKHRQQRCVLQARKYFNCKYCDKEYGSLGALKMHIRTHTLPCVCKICGKAFSRPWLLQGHIRTHTGEKPYSCSHCSRAFADRSNLRAHLQTHSDVKKYQCRGCSKTFSRMSLLSRHEEAGCCPAS